MNSRIKYLLKEDIDISKWDQCVSASPNGLCYADSVFLDTMCENWNALVLGDYEAVMPLVYRKKFGISYLYQPAFVQQLGIINIADTDFSDLFLKHIPAGFKYWDIRLNFSNRPSETTFHLRKNYLLHLDGEHKYSRNAVRNIKTAIDHGVNIIENVPPRIVLDLHIERFGKTEGIELLNKYLQSENIYTVAAKIGDKYVASSAYILYKNRITFIINGNLIESLASGATHLLKDHVINKFSGMNRVLDFEGSETPNFARFYQQFGAKEIEYYPHIINNRLPWPLKLLK